MYQDDDEEPMNIKPHEKLILAVWIAFVVGLILFFAYRIIRDYNPHG